MDLRWGILTGYKELFIEGLWTTIELTLVAIVLSIGLVCDDAIVVLENIYSKIEEGMAPLEAAMTGSREIYFAVISTTFALAAVFLANNRLYADVQDLLMGVLHALTATIDAKDRYTCGHSQRVAMLSKLLALSDYAYFSLAVMVASGVKSRCRCVCVPVM